jgi:alkylation response protein AidB-like acyl-CoA dehydrogenase
MEFDESEEVAALRSTLRRYLDKECPPSKVERWDREDFIPREELLRLGELGVCGLCIPEEYGGLGHNVVAMAAAIEELARCCAGFAAYYIMCAGYGGLNISESGSLEQKRRLLPELAVGRISFSYGLSEPNVGADLSKVATRATREGDRILINGAKRWTSGASMNDYIYTLVRSGPPEQNRKNLTFVLVPTGAKGLSMTNLSAMGHNGTPMADVVFDQVELSIDDVVGGEAGWNNGWSALAGPALEVEKLGPTAIALGIAEAALAEAWSYSQNRVQGGKRICAHQSVRHVLADAQTQLQACRLMLANAAWLVQEGKPSATATSMAKLFVTERAKEVTLACQQQVMGAYGYAFGFQMQRYVRDILAIPIYGGSSAIQRNNIANLLRLPKE